MEKALMRIRESLPRKIRIIYANPLYRDLFTGNGFSEFFHQQQGLQLEVSIFSN
jgi:hypothetical protein